MDPAIALPTKVVLTGAGGFLGAALANRIGPHQRLALGDAAWRAAIATADWRDATVVHLAARVHDRHGKAADFEHDNVVKTTALAEAAAEGGALRFVFASTIKVHGEETRNEAFRPESPPRPADAYAWSKWRAEEALRANAARSGMALAIVRFPLVYGANVGGNFRALLGLADSPLWLPLAAIGNRRSVVHLRDAVQALVLASSHSRAPGHAFIAAHPVAVSTPELVRAIRAALGRPARLFPVPATALEAAAVLAGARDRMRRLTRSLEGDSSTLRDDLGWSPCVGLADGVADTVASRCEKGAR